MKRTPWYEYLTRNIHWLGLNMVSGSLTPIILPYLVARYVAETSKGTYLGLLRAAGLVLAIVVQPFAGLISDRSSSRWGRRRPFILAGTLLSVACLALVGLARNYWQLFIAVLLLQFSANVAHGALQGIIPDLFPLERRGRASAAKALMELLPIIVIGFSIGPVIGVGNVRLAILGLMAILAVTMVITVMTVHEEPRRMPHVEPLRPAATRVLMLAVAFVSVTMLFGGLAGAVTQVWHKNTGWHHVLVGLSGLLAMAGAVVLGVWCAVRAGIGQVARRQTAFTWWVVNRLLYLTAVGSIQSFAQYYLQDVLAISDVPSATGRLMATVGTCTLVSALSSVWLCDTIDRRTLVGLSGVLAAGGTCFLLMAHEMALVTVAAALLGLATGTFLTVNWALGVDLAPSADAGLYLGISNLAGAGAGIIGAGIGGPLADFFNSHQRGLGYLVIFGIYGVLFLLSALALVKVRPSGENADRARMI